MSRNIWNLFFRHSISIRRDAGAARDRARGIDAEISWALGPQLSHGCVWGLARRAKHEPRAKVHLGHLAIMVFKVNK